MVTFSLILYNLIVILSVYFAYIANKIKNNHRYLFLLVSGFIIFIPSAIRKGIGTDYNTYKDLFICIDRGENDLSYLRMEPLFYYINKIISLLGIDFYGVIIITSFLFCLFIIKCIDKHVGIWIFLFSILILYLQSFNIIRQSIALSISCYGLYLLFYYDKKYHYILLIFLSSLFHLSGLLGFIILAINNVKFNYIQKILILISFYIIFSSSFLIEIFNNPLLMDSKYGVYVSGDDVTSTELGSGIGVVLKIYPYIVVSFFGKHIFDNHPKRIMLENISLVYLCAKISTLYIVIFARIEVAMMFMGIFVLAESCRYAMKSQKNMIFAIVLLSTEILLFENRILVNHAEVVPYQSLFD